MQYAWDEDKAAENIRKHGVSFPEAATACDDPNAIVAPDTARGELRLNVTGFSNQARLLFVVCIEVDDDLMRIISARRATTEEASEYGNP